MNDNLSGILLILSIKSFAFFFFSVCLSVFYLVFRNGKWARIWALSAAILLTLSTVCYGVLDFQLEATEAPSLYESLVILLPSISLSAGVSIILYLFGLPRTAYALMGVAAALIFFNADVIANPYFLLLPMGAALYAGMLFIATLIVGIIRLIKKDRANFLRWGYVCLTSLVFACFIAVCCLTKEYAQGVCSQLLQSLMLISPIIYLSTLKKVTRQRE